MIRKSHSSWQELLANPRPGDHIVQLYQDDVFHAEAVSQFALEGVIKGESVILVATPDHWTNIAAQLRTKGVDPDQLKERGQLSVFDALDTLPKVMSGAMPDEAVFTALGRGAVEKARCEGRFPQVRWWGEMVGVLHEQGLPAASERMDRLFDDLTIDCQLKSFCSFRLDKLDPAIYHETFGALCRTHSHVIPTRDYVGHRMVVNRAIGEVLGSIDGALLRSLTSWNDEIPNMPSSHALLLWVKATMPERFPDVLSRASALQ